MCLSVCISLFLWISVFLPPLSQSLSACLWALLAHPSTPHPCPSLPCSSPSICLCLTTHHHCLFLHPQDSASTLTAPQDAGAEPVLAGTRASGSLPVAAAAVHWGLLAPGPHSGLDLHLLQQLSSPPVFPTAPKTQLVLGSPRPGECGQEHGSGGSGWMDFLRVRNGVQVWTGI